MMETIEVHNVWTIYGMNGDGTEAVRPVAELSRPQDWGHPRWFYNRFRFDWVTEETHYINHCHCWTDLKREQHEYPGLFASLIVQILMPGCEPELCGRQYLHEDDFWSSEWGEMPPIIEREEYEDFYPDYYLDEEE
jgi:hypothetical protein